MYEGLHQLLRTCAQWELEPHCFRNVLADFKGASSTAGFFFVGHYTVEPTNELTYKADSTAGDGLTILYSSFASQLAFLCSNRGEATGAYTPPA